jgi:putative transposase
MDTQKRFHVGLAAPDTCCELGIRSATFCKWRAKYGLVTSNIARIKGLEAENSLLMKMYTEERLKAELLNEVIKKKW